MLIRFHVGGDASPASIAEYFKARRYDKTNIAGILGGGGRGGQFAPKASGVSSSRQAAPVSYDDAVWNEHSPVLPILWQPTGSPPERRPSALTTPCAA